MFTKIALLALFVAVASATEGWESCANSGVVIKKLEIEGCAKTPCTFIKGRSYKVDVTAVADRVSATLPYTVTVNMLGQDIPFVSGNACEHLTNGKCPTSNGAEFTFSKPLEITSQYPDLDSYAKAIVKDDAGNVGICVKFDIKTVSA